LREANRLLDSAVSRRVSSISAALDQRWSGSRESARKHTQSSELVTLGLMVLGEGISLLMTLVSVSTSLDPRKSSLPMNGMVNLRSETCLVEQHGDKVLLLGQVRMKDLHRDQA
jgi:hypothetical protein